MSNEPAKTVRVTHVFNAPPERVFDAWLDPATARRWLFKTPTGQSVRTEIDPRVGGRFTIVDRRDGEDVEHTGQYLQIERPRRLVFEFAVPKYSSKVTRVSIDIVENGAGCEVTLLHDDIAQDQVARTENGWATTLRGLESALGTEAGR